MNTKSIILSIANSRKIITIFLILIIFSGNGLAQSFVHPGMLHKESDFVRMRTKVAQNAQPWKSGYDKLVANPKSSSGYGMSTPQDTVYRGYDGVHRENYVGLYNDVAAAYANALRWKVSGNTANADKAVEILNAWGRTLKCVSGNTNAYLATGIYGYEIANAAEIMRTYSGWKATDFATFQNMMIKVFYSMNHDFFVRHNGTCDTHYWVNWDLCNMAAMMSIGILCDNRAIYNEAVTYFKSGIGTGNIRRMVNYLYDGNLGQWQESGRDQGHSTMGPALAGAFCEMAWSQGDDLYGYDDNRLWKGCEYVAKYNLGNAVPYTPYTNCDNFTQTVIATGGRMMYRPVWELIFNHYVNRKGLTSPYVQILAEQHRPEGGGGDYGTTSGGYDQIGYGTLTTSLETLPKTSQTITFPALTAMLVGDADQDPGATATSGSRCYYVVSDPTIAEIVNNKIHAIRCGSTTVTAWQVGDEIYASATPVSQTMTVTDPISYLEGTFVFRVQSTNMCIDVNAASTAEGASIIQYAGPGGANEQWTLTRIQGNYFKLININSGKSLDVVGNSNAAGALIEQRTYTGENYQIWEVTDNCDGTVKLINKGSGLALGVTGASTASAATYGVNTYTGGTHQKFTYDCIIPVKKIQVISFGVLPRLYPGDPDITLTATASSGLPITYTSTNTSIATVTNGILHVLKGGTVSIVASQSGSTTYEPAIDVAQVLITKKAQTITFPTFSEIHYKDPSFGLVASSDSRLPLIYASSSTSVASIFSGSLTVGIPGVSIISVTQAGNLEYMPARVEQTLNVLKLDQTISFPILPTLTLGNTDYSPGSTTESNLTINYTSSNTNVATIVNRKIHVIGEGTSDITATQSGNTFYNEAPSVTQTLLVGTTGLNNISSDIKVYGNSLTHELRVVFSENIDSNSRISVYNSIGKMVYQTNICTLDNHILLNDVGNSIYLVNIFNNGLIYTVKVLL